MRYIKFALIGLAFALTGCASGVKFSEMSQSIKTVPADQGRVYFYRSASMFGAALQPNIYLDDAVVGASKPGGFFYVDLAPGPHKASTSTEVENRLTFVIDGGETKYVRTSPSFGVLVGHITPELVSPDEARPELQSLSYIGTVAGPSAPAPTATPAPAAPVAAAPSTRPAVVQAAPAAAVTVAPARETATHEAPTTRTLTQPVEVQKTEFILGVSSNSVEKLARQSGCESAQGAGLISEPGPLETYSVQCRDGRVFLARCELRQCDPLQ
jgi:hypothetical protein